jgi:hypothetical protein
MPFQSKAQQRKFFADPRLRKYAKEWAAATPSIKSLPEHKARLKREAQRRAR